MKATDFLKKPTPAETALVGRLEALGQTHLVASWSAPGKNEPDKKAFLAELQGVEASYPGGLEAYVTNARKLLAESKAGVNPFEGLKPLQPNLIDLTRFTEDFERAENLGLERAKGLAVVLVAGGLGERLGYPGIKIDIPVEIATETSYLGLYARWALALGQRAKTQIPFIIMTSRDTHGGTVQSLKKNKYFGLKPAQVHLIRQELVPALIDDQARLATEGPYQLVMKPHGHGDVHMLLHTSGLAAKLEKAGKTHLAFIQDTNGQVLNVLLPALGVSIQHDFTFNSMAVGRVPGEAVGALTRLKGGGRDMTLNVEYNQLDALLRATVSPQGDVAGENGLSIFPGNINVLMVHLPPYRQILEKSRGIIAEFVNPKYTDETRTAFKKPTRLETMMQDLPKLFTPQHKTGVTLFERRYSFSADKNALPDAREKAKIKSPPESGASAESDFYHSMRRKAVLGGLKCPVARWVEYAGIPFEHGARVVFDPSFVLTILDARRRIDGGLAEADSTLVVKGPDVRLLNLTLRGRAALFIDAVPGARLTVENVVLDRPGAALVPLTAAEMASPKTPAWLKIRAYRQSLEKPLVIKLTKPGVYHLGPDLKVKAQGKAAKKTAPAKKKAPAKKHL